MNAAAPVPNRRSFWPLVWSLGLIGQLCWFIENQWFNTFVYTKIARDSNIVTAMVMVSAIVTTVCTFIFGTLADRMGNRKRFVSIGYVTWGIFTIAFGFTEFLADGTGTGATITLVASLVVLANAIMSFFGSMGNDSGFQGWINDHLNSENRGQVGAALAVHPVIGTIVGTVGGGLLVGATNNYQRLFWVMGILVIAIGVLAWLFMNDSPDLRPYRSGTFWEQFISIFNFKALFRLRELKWVCFTIIVFFISFNIHFVHMGNWLLFRMGFTADNMGLIQGAGLVLAMILAIPGAKLINVNRTPQVALVGTILNLVGLLALTLFVRPGTADTSTAFSIDNLPLLLCVFFVGAGYILVMQSLNIWAKQLYPEQSRGQFEGVRIVAFVLIPMLIGTFIGNIVVRSGAGAIVNEFGITEFIPTESIFLWGLILLLPIFIPLMFATRIYRRRIQTVT